MPERPLDELIPANLLRERPPELPEVSEPEIVRHYNRLSRRNFDLDTGPYPLGSCTMKHNPRLNERVAALPGHARLHPAQDPKRAQGALELMWRLERALAEICGLEHVSLQPSAGSHGELAGLLLTRAYHDDRGEERSKVLTPDTAHGTNPASVTMAGYDVVKVATDGRGGVDLDDLRSKVDDHVACLMLTNPNTLGLFDENIAEITRMVRDAGGTLYYDGANLNAIMGHTRPGDMGFDIVHVNLHKSFSQPHGGRRAGGGADRGLGPDRALPARPAPGPPPGRGRRRAPPSALDYERPEVDRPPARLPGQLRRLRPLLRVHPQPRRRRSHRGIRDRGAERQLPAGAAARGRAGRYLPVAFDRLCMHEFVLSGAPAKRELQVKTLDVAKRLLDYGFHPPTIYFPLLVDEALMFEPTETETREGLDALADADRGDPRRGRARPRDPPEGALHDPRAAPRRGEGQPAAGPASARRLIAALGPRA